MTYLDKTAIDKTEPRPGGSAHGPAGPPKVMKTSGGARTPRCRVHTRVNALDSVATGVRKSANTARRSACATTSSTERYRVQWRFAHCHAPRRSRHGSARFVEELCLKKL